MLENPFLSYFVKRFILTLSFLLIFAYFIISYPELYWFSHRLNYKSYSIFYDKEIPKSIFTILDEVDQLIKKSDLYDPKITIKIYVRSDEHKYNSLLPYQFPKHGLGWKLPINNNIFIFKSDISKNESYQALKPNYFIPLSYVIAHEAAHVLIESKSFLNSCWLSKINKNNCVFGIFGFLWKDEGYAEYIAGGQFTLEEGILELKKAETTKEQNLSIKGDVEYFKYFLCIKYLIEKKNLKIKEIFETDLNFDSILTEAIKAFDRIE